MTEGHSWVLHGKRAGEPSALTYSSYRLGEKKMISPRLERYQANYTSSISVGSFWMKSPVL